WRMEKGVNEINNLFDGTPLPGLRDMPTYQQGSTSYTPTSGFSGVNLNDFISGGGGRGILGKITSQLKSNNGPNIAGYYYLQRTGPEGESRRVPWTPELEARLGKPRHYDPEMAQSAQGNAVLSRSYDLNKMLQSG